MAAYDVLHFIACRDCGELYPIRVPGDACFDDPDVPGADAYKEFLTRHRAHHLASLWRSGAETRADRPFWDPLATLSFEATDGDRSYVVTASRRSIEDERSYRFVVGALEVGNSEVQIDPQDLRRGLDLQFYPHALHPTKVDRFLAAVHDVISQIDPTLLEIAFDAADDPDVSVAPMPEAVCDELLARCTQIFDTWELPRVRAFLRANRDADGLLALRVCRHVTALSA